MSAGKWVEEELDDLAKRVGSAAVMSRLDISSTPGAVVLDSDTSDLLVLERRRGQKFWKLVVAMMAERAWSESWTSSTLPDLFATVLSDDEDIAVRALATIKEMWELIEEVEKSENHTMQKLMHDLGWHKHQLVRELIQAWSCLHHPKDHILSRRVRWSRWLRCYPGVFMSRFAGFAWWTESLGGRAGGLLGVWVSPLPPRLHIGWCAARHPTVTALLACDRNRLSVRAFLGGRLIFGASIKRRAFAFDFE
jgi:hypothetical protein